MECRFARGIGGKFSLAKLRGNAANSHDTAEARPLHFGQECLDGGYRRPIIEGEQAFLHRQGCPSNASPLPHPRIEDAAIDASMEGPCLIYEGWKSLQIRQIGGQQGNPLRKSRILRNVVQKCFAPGRSYHKPALAGIFRDQGCANSRRSAGDPYHVMHFSKISIGEIRKIEIYLPPE